MEDEEAHTTTHDTLVRGFAWILVYADLEIQRQAHHARVGDMEAAAYVLGELRNKIQSLLDSDELWMKGMRLWSTMMEGYAAEGLDPVTKQLKNCLVPLGGVQVGMESLISTTQRLYDYEMKLWNQYPELYQNPT